MWYPYHEFSWAWLIGMGLMMILFWGGLIVLGSWMFRAVTGGNVPRASNRAGNEAQDRSSGDRALDILRERYARGEISREEFEQIRDDLRM
jgi:putative membrane protein